MSGFGIYLKLLKGEETNPPGHEAIPDIPLVCGAQVPDLGWNILKKSD